MSTLHERIDAAEQVVLADLAAAEAVLTDWNTWVDYADQIATAWVETSLSNTAIAHALRQSPKVTITRCRQELQRIAADRDLLYRIDTTGNEHGHEWLFNAALANLEAHYPQEVPA